MFKYFCRIGCWATAAAVGLFAAWAIYSFVGLGMAVAAIIGLILFVILAWGLPEVICTGEVETYVSPSGQTVDTFADASPAAPEAAAPAPEASAAEPESASPAAEEAPTAAPETKAAASAPAAAASGQAHWTSGVAAESGLASSGRGQQPLKAAVAPAEEETLRDGVGTWRYEAPAAAANPAPAPQAADAPAADAEVQPEILSAPRNGGADDLKRIKGVGPGLEKTLNEMGFFHFDQIAVWSSAEIEWVDARLKFKGRIVRDDWIGQAKSFSAEG